MGSTVKASVPDLRDLERQLLALDTRLKGLVGDVARSKLGPLVREVSEAFPFDPAHRGWGRAKTRPSRGKRRDPGHIRDSVAGTVDRGQLAIRTTHPGGAVHWWGGTIAPKGASIRIPQSGGEDFSSRKAREVADAVAVALERLLRELDL